MPVSLLLAAAILTDPGVKSALAYLEANHDAHFARQIKISEIPAPTFNEKLRGEFIASEFRRLGLQQIETDPRGNVLGWRPGKSPRAIAVAAHLDTVFPAGTNLKVRQQGKRYLGPGLGDDSNGLATQLAIIEALQHGKIATNHTVLFVANCCEEGLGDFQGIKYLFNESPHRARIDGFIDIDGTNPDRIVNGALASKRYRVNITGPGGHSYGNFGRVSPMHALGRAMDYFATASVPERPKTTYNIGKIGGGTSINAIAAEAWMEVDMRSESESELEKIEQHLLASVRRGVDEENKLRAKSGTKLAYETKLLATKRAGFTPEASPIVEAAKWAAGAVGLKPTLEISSTDSNVPINLGIPAITLSGGGHGGSHHAPDEWYEPDGAWKGRQQILLTILSYDEKAAK